MSTAAKTTSYAVEGRLLEVCACNVLCPLLGRRGPGRGRDVRFDPGLVRRPGTVMGVDVSDRCLCLSVHVPGNVLAGNWRAAILVDDRCTPQQQECLLDVFSGRLGGPIADSRRSSLRSWPSSGYRSSSTSSTAGVTSGWETWPRHGWRRSWARPG